MVRAAVPADAQAIVDIINPIVRETTISFSTEEKTAEEFATLIAGGRPVWVSEHEGRITGYATSFQFRNGPGYARTLEHSIALAPGGRGHGAGRALMAALESHAAANGAHSIFAGVSAENPAGVAFHAAIGFREVARLPRVGWKFGRWLDLVLMQKFLSDPEQAG
ncbi:GNAT family N-acetyltransferase [Tropicimonas sediminicola]|uniref:GNAT family N-acetyltransferase n=1 Tax=Tropicimonas sediminicola TaxID=1031541 RepID=UPI0015950AD8|nr:GNAT family N-acetyltransferase [Tropicimonas sediminicola]